jgi:hypothetical protein
MTIAQQLAARVTDVVTERATFRDLYVWLTDRIAQLEELDDSELSDAAWRIVGDVQSGEVDEREGRLDLRTELSRFHVQRAPALQLVGKAIIIEQRPEAPAGESRAPVAVLAGALRT